MSWASWAATLAGYDDDALAALANRGLVRRAKKDAAPTLRAQSEETVEAESDGQNVTLRVPLTASTCTCGQDGGVCRHVLAVILAVRDAREAEPAPPVDLAAELLAIDAGAVAAWAGLPLLKKAAVSLAHGFAVEEKPASIVVTLPAQNVTVRYLGGGIDALLCSCHAPGPCEHKAAALLAFRAEKTGVDPSLEPAALREKGGAVRTRDGVREAVIALLEELVTLGLCRLPASAEGRLRTLGTAAHGVDLPRLERELTALAEVVRLVRARHAGGDTAALLAGAGCTYALAHALATPTSALVGVHRSSYLPVAGAVELIGVGAARWQTGSGYHGLTVYFWQPEAAGGGRWTSWTDARPVDARGFDPAGRFGSDPPWAGAASPRDAAAKRWRVTGLHRNAAGRISAREGSRGSSTDSADPADGPRVERFADLGSIRERLAGVGLSADTGPLDALALVRPAAWGPPLHDAVTQRASRTLIDPDGETLTLSVTHGPAAGDAVATLLKLGGGDVLCRLRADGTAEPITVWSGADPLHLTLDPTPPGPASAAAASAGAALRARPLAESLDRVRVALREQAEAGAGVPRPAPPWPVTPPPTAGLSPAAALLRHAWFAQLAADAA